MGIQGLFQIIKPCLEERTLFSFKGKTAALDAMSYLYKGCYGFAYELNNNINTSSYIIYILRIIRQIQSNGIDCIAVFDGRNLKAKALTAQKRSETKKLNLSTAQQLQKEGKEAEANKFYQRCLHVTKAMIYETIRVLKAYGIKFMISPYESDSQISYLVRSGQVDFAIGEDSDLVCFACPRIAFKIQKDSTCSFLDADKWINNSNRKEIKNESTRGFWSQSELNRIYICVLSGCDYFPGAPGIGLKKAISFFEKFGNLEEVIKAVKRSSKSEFPENYLETVDKIALIFKHQRVYDPRVKELVMINDINEDEEVEDRLHMSAEKKKSNQQSSHEYRKQHIDEKMIGEVIDNFSQMSEGIIHIDNGEYLDQQKVDLEKLFGKHKWKEFLLNNTFQQNEGKREEKKSYSSLNLDQEQMKQLRELRKQKQEIDQVQDYISQTKRNEENEADEEEKEYHLPTHNKSDHKKKNKLDDIGDLLDKYNEVYADDHFNEEDDNEEEREEGGKQIVISTEEKQRREEQNARYFRGLCDTFLKDYVQLLKENLQENQDKEINLLSISDFSSKEVKKQHINPFAKTNNKNNSENITNSASKSNEGNLPNSLEFFGAKKVEMIPPKKKVQEDSNNMNNNEEKNSKKLLSLKDYFSKKK